MRLKNTIFVLLILGSVTSGYFLIQKASRDGIAEREATERYLAANPPPKAIEMKIEGCPPDSWNTKLFGYTIVLDTIFTVPCSLSNGKYYLRGRQFSLRWSESLRDVANSRLSFSVLFESPPKTILLSDLDTEQAPTEIKGLNQVRVALPKHGAMYFDCGDFGCRGWTVVSPDFRALINVHSDKKILQRDLALVVERVFSRVNSRN